MHVPKGGGYPVRVFALVAVGAGDTVHIPRAEQAVGPLIVGKGPSPRTGHSAVLLPDGHSVLYSGGWNPDKPEGEQYCEDSFGTMLT